MEKMTDRVSDRLSWIRDLVRAEEAMEDVGVVEIGNKADTERLLIQETLQYLQTLKNDFVDASSAFNEMKSSPLGRIKIYGIAKTHADFMLFRNGFKMIFSLKAPGQISIRFNFIGPNYIPAQIPSSQQSATPMMEEHVLEAKVGAFDEIQWTFQKQPIKSSYVVRYHLSLFIRESAK
jgi:hypothetical protein